MRDRKGSVDLNVFLAILNVMLLIWLVVMIVPKGEEEKALGIDTEAGFDDIRNDIELQVPGEFEDDILADDYWNKLLEKVDPNQGELGLEPYIKTEKETVELEDYFIYCVNITSLTITEGFFYDFAYPSVLVFLYDLDAEEIYHFDVMHHGFYRFEKEEQAAEVCASLKFGLMRSNTAMMISVMDVASGKEAFTDYQVEIE